MLSILSLAVAILPLALAAPGAELEKRTAGNIYMCTGSSWSSTCSNVLFTLGACTQIPEPWYQSLGSAGADHGAHCVLFDSAHSTCTGTGIAFLDSPGADDLYTENNAGVAGDFGHQAAYILCTTCTAC